MGARRSPIAVILLGMAVVSACTTTSEGEPRPATTSEESSAPGSSTTGANDGELPLAGAPEVDDPLDTSRYEQDPCRSLTPSQAESLNLSPTGKPDDEVAGLALQTMKEA